MFIALYGINNIGKSIQIQRLKTYFESLGKTVKCLKYPIYDLKPTGPKINALLRNPKITKIQGEEFQLLYIQNRLDFEPMLLRYVNDFDIVLAEDYIGTGIAWGMTQGLRFETIEELNRKHPQKKPDVQILLDGERFLSGKEKNHRNEEDNAAVKKTREHFLWLAKKYGWPVVNANQSEIKVTEDIIRGLIKFIA